MLKILLLKKLSRQQKMIRPNYNILNHKSVNKSLDYLKCIMQLKYLFDKEYCHR